MPLNDILAKLESNIVVPWLRWKNLLTLDGVRILSDDDTGIDLECPLSFVQMREVLGKCHIQIAEPVSKADALEEWKREYDRVAAQRPKYDEILATEDGEPVRLTIDVLADREPFICARIYVPDVAGSDLAWFAQSIHAEKDYGLKVIMMPKARMQVARVFGLSKRVVGVASIKIIGASVSTKSLLGEVHEF